MCVSDSITVSRVYKFLNCGEVALPHSIVCDVIALSVLNFNVDFCTVCFELVK